MVIKDYKWNTKLDIVCVKMVHEMGLMDITETREIPINYYSKNIYTEKNIQHYHPSWDNHDHSH